MHIKLETILISARFYCKGVHIYDVIYATFTHQLSSASKADR